MNTEDYCDSGSSYLTFKEAPQATEGRTIYELGNGQWNIPALRTMLLNGRQVFYDGDNHTSLLLANITERRALERETIQQAQAGLRGRHGSPRVSRTTERTWI